MLRASLESMELNFKNNRFAYNNEDMFKFWCYLAIEVGALWPKQAVDSCHCKHSVYNAYDRIALSKGNKV